LSISKPIPEIFAVKLKSCTKSRRILDVFAFPNFQGQCLPKKLYISDNTLLAARHVAKFCEATPLSAKVLLAHTLHVKPIFDPLLEKNVGGIPIPGEVCTSKL